MKLAAFTGGTAGVDGDFWTTSVYKGIMTVDLTSTLDAGLR